MSPRSTACALERPVGQGAWKPGFIVTLHGAASSHGAASAHGASDQWELSRNPTGAGWLLSEMKYIIMGIYGLSFNDQVPSLELWVPGLVHPLSSSVGHC